MSGKLKFLIKNSPPLVLSYPFQLTPQTDPPSSLTRCYFIVTEFTFSVPRRVYFVQPIWTWIYVNPSRHFFCTTTSNDTPRSIQRWNMQQYNHLWLNLGGSFFEAARNISVDRGSSWLLLIKRCFPRIALVLYWQLFVPVIITAARVSTGLLCDRPCNHQNHP